MKSVLLLGGLFNHKVAAHFDVSLPFGLAHGMRKYGIHADVCVGPDNLGKWDDVNYIGYEANHDDITKYDHYMIAYPKTIVDIFGGKRGDGKGMTELDHLREACMKKGFSLRLYHYCPGNYRFLYDNATILFIENHQLMRMFPSYHKYPDHKGKLILSESGCHADDVIPEGWDDPSPYDDDKINMVYTGRFQQRENRFLFLSKLSQAMTKRWKRDFNITILCPTFNDPTDGNKMKTIYSHPDEFQQIGQDIFKHYGGTNIEFKPAIPWGKHFPYIRHADIALSFSIANVMPDAINCKLCDYLRCGTPVIDEPFAPNSYWINDVRGGMIAPNFYDLRQYFMTLSAILNRKWDHSKTMADFITKHSFDVRAAQMLKHLTSRKAI